MKETLHQKVQSMYNSLISRENQLEKHIKDYAENENYESAHKNQIKLDMIKMFKTQLLDALNHN